MFYYYSFLDVEAFYAGQIILSPCTKNIPCLVKKKKKNPQMLLNVELFIVPRLDIWISILLTTMKCATSLLSKWTPTDPGQPLTTSAAGGLKLEWHSDCPKQNTPDKVELLIIGVITLWI